MSTVEWVKTERGLVARCDDHEVAWTPQPGAQRDFLECPIFEVLIEGNRGGGKTDALLMDFGQHVGVGFGDAWMGILFRHTYPELEDVVRKSKHWFPRIWPMACYNEAKSQWAWPTGEMLLFRHMAREEDYWGHHGKAYPWIGWEELTTWPSDACYRIMMSCSRSTRLRMPRKYRATTNSYGIGLHWVKNRFKLAVAPGHRRGPIITDESGLKRVAIHSEFAENKVLVTAEPDYMRKILMGSLNPAMQDAWERGSWDIVAGGMFNDLWDARVHVVPDVEWKQIPSGWRRSMSYDHGRSRPFSVGFWVESDGEPIKVGGRFLGVARGDLIRVDEWYGWNGRPNEGLNMHSAEIADGISQRLISWGIRGSCSRGAADPSIFTDYEPGKSVAGEMARRGIQWEPADNARKQGWDQLRKLLAGAVPGKEGVREGPGLFVTRRCEQFIRTIPTLPRSGRDLDDADTKAEDHVADEVRYRVRERDRRAASIEW